MARYYNLAHGTKPLEYAKGFPGPYDIAVSFDAVPYPVAFSEGVGAGAAGTTVSAVEAISETWASHFEITGALWLLPYIRRLVQGIPLPQDEMLRMFERLSGTEPAWFDTRE
jgi:hypothetical protein